MPGLLGIYQEVVRGGCARTIPELLTELEIDVSQGTLAAIAELCRTLEENGLTLIPPVTEGQVDARRTVTVLTVRRLDEAGILSEIALGESSIREFKSTLQFDLRRRISSPGLPTESYRSDKVLHGVLKTIAAYINTSGGVLLIGVADDGSVHGLNDDYSLRATPDRDRFELFLRDCIRGKFYEGNLVSAFVRIDFVTIAGRDVARIEVTPRPHCICCLSKPDSDTLSVFRRDGNGTVEVRIEHMEEFVRMRWALQTAV